VRPDRRLERFDGLGEAGLTIEDHPKGRHGTRRSWRRA
jgi:hypothetical protein